MRKILLLGCLASLLINSCTKVDLLLSDFSKVDIVDENGSRLSNETKDGQWENSTFSKSEMALFKSLDTADLTGTTTPLSTCVPYALPNPFVHTVNFPAYFNSEFNGQIVAKYVIVNHLMKAVQKGSIRIKAASGALFAIRPDFESGNYRIYLTYSAKGNEHFFKTWGNIERK